MKRRLLVSTLGIALLGACAGTSVQQDYKLSQQGATGLVVGSITYTGQMALFRVLFESKATREKYQAEVGESMTMNIARAMRPAEPDALLGVPGGLFAIELPAGQYQLTGWRVSQGMGVMTPSQQVAIDFQVEAGKATYLGNVHFVETGKTFLATTSVTVVLQDKRARDLPALEKQFPTLASNPVDIALADGTRIENLGLASQLKVTVPLFVPLRK